MALQIRRGTSADVASESFVPLIGEPLYLTDDQKLYIGDGSTQGGNVIGGATDLAELTSVTLIDEAVGALNLYQVTSNTVLVTLAVGQGAYSVGLEVVISNSSVAALNGTHTITSIPTGSQFTFSLTTADVTSASVTGVVTPKIPDGNILTWNSAANYWENGAPASAVNVVDDTTPQLGGNLDTNNKTIISTGTNNIEFDPATGQNVIFKGNATDGSGRIVLNCEDNSHGIIVKGPPHSAGANYTLTLPTDTGTNNQLLKTDGSGVLSWINASSAITSQFTSFQFNLAAAPTGAVAASQDLGQAAAIGTFSELTYANYFTNSAGPTSAAYDPTLTGITESSGTFSGFTAGIYRIEASLKITIDNLAPNSYLNYNHEIRPLTGSTQLPGTSQDFNFTTTGSSPGSAVNQRVNMSVVCYLENSTSADNKIRFLLNSDQSNDYYCSGGTVTFTRIA